MLQSITTNTVLRSFLRRAGVLGIIKRVAGLRSRSYEDRFASALLAEVRPGDVVWDVGANIGYYTCKLGERTGPSGRVLAFEPVQASFQRMSDAVKSAGLHNVQPMHLALGGRADSFAIPVTTESDGVTNSLAKTTGAGKMETITVDSGDQLIAHGSPPPDVIKIDVEAYEEEVVFGLRNLWHKRQCRAVFVEVHFQQLEQRGLRRAPGRLQSYFKDAGYAVTWLDASHFQATVRVGQTNE